MAAAEAPLLPGNPYRGGALVTRDASGREMRLALRKLHVDVHIEHGFARTTIDQTYFNHDSSRLEGTFYFPLPPDASLSRLAMYVGENLMEGGMAEREHARNVYEQIVYAKRDPALLEWVDGSTFKMRVFPIEGRQEKRVLLSDTQRLATAYGRTAYRFPAGNNLAVEREWSAHVRVKGGAAGRWSSPSHDLTAKRDGGDLVLDSSTRSPWSAEATGGTPVPRANTPTTPGDDRPVPPAPLPVRGGGESERDLVLELIDQPAGATGGGALDAQPNLAELLTAILADAKLVAMIRDDELVVSTAAKALAMLHADAVESAAEALLRRIQAGVKRSAPVVVIPRFSDFSREFSNLTVWAPGLRANRADVLGTLEAEVPAWPKPAAAGADVRCVDERTVDVTPRQVESRESRVQDWMSPSPTPGARGEHACSSSLPTTADWSSGERLTPTVACGGGSRWRRMARWR